MQRAVLTRIFSEWKLHLLRHWRKSLRDFSAPVAGVRCRLLPFPSFLPAVSGEHTGVGEIIPAGDALVHYLVDFPYLPLFRFVKIMVQGFFVKLLGADGIAGVAVKESLYHPGLGVLRHEVPLVFL